MPSCDCDCGSGCHKSGGEPAEGKRYGYGRAGAEAANLQGDKVPVLCGDRAASVRFGDEGKRYVPTGACAIREYISEHGASYVIPPQSNVSDPWPVDWHLYKERHLVECFFQKIKWFRRIATRFDKSDASFLAFVYLASIAILLL